MAVKALRLARRAKELVRTDAEGSRWRETLVAARLQINKTKTTYEARYHAFGPRQKAREEDAANPESVCRLLAEAEAVIADLA